MFFQIYNAVEFYQSGSCVVFLTSNKMSWSPILFSILVSPLGQQSSNMVVLLCCSETESKTYQLKGSTVYPR